MLDLTVVTLIFLSLGVFFVALADQGGVPEGRGAGTNHGSGGSHGAGVNRPEGNGNHDVTPPPPTESGNEALPPAVPPPAPSTNEPAPVPPATPTQDASAPPPSAPPAEGNAENQTPTSPPGQTDQGVETPLPAPAGEGETVPAEGATPPAEPDAGAAAPAPSVQAVCGDSTCDDAAGETPATCPADCDGTAPPIAPQPAAPAPTPAETETPPSDAAVPCGNGRGSGAGACKPEKPAPAKTEAPPSSVTAPCKDGRGSGAGACKPEQPASPVRPVEARVPADMYVRPERSAPLPPAVQSVDVLSPERYLPRPCVARGLTDAAACAQAMRTGGAETPPLPEECVAGGAKTAAECDALLAQRAVLPSCATEGAKTGADCNAHIAAQVLPDLCTRKGILDEGLCREAAAEDYVSPSCRAQGVYTVEGCKALALSSAVTGSAAGEAPTVTVPQEGLPARCVEGGILDPAVCGKFMSASTLPPDCLAAGLDGADSCAAMLNAKHVDPVCASSGITDPEACRQFVLGRVRGVVACVGLDPAQCATALKDRHLGETLAAREDLGRVGDTLKAAAVRGELDLSALAVRGDDLHARALAILPVAPSAERTFRVIPSRALIAVRGDDTVAAGAGSILAYDTDGDGVPDDVELRHGLDPEDARTNDGVSDLAAFRRMRLAGIDRAIADGLVVGQPLAEGETDPALAVIAPPRLPNGLRLHGSAPKGTKIVTLYVYSELPLVLTTTVDADGQWSYSLNDDLKEGRHEIYVAVNDATGRVVKKSAPFALVVRGASAESLAAAVADEAVAGPAPVSVAAAARDSQANAERGTRPETDFLVYAVAGGLLVVTGLAFVIALLFPAQPSKKRKR